MTRKDYQAIADVIKAVSIRDDARYMIAVELAAAFQKHNENFNKSKFYRACGLEDMP